MRKEITAAVEYLSTLKTGDPVTVKDGGREYNMFVSRPARRSDGPFGSYESTRVTVTFGPGRYSREVTAEQMANGSVDIERT